jgi:UDP-glucose 4-epimerase
MKCLVLGGGGFIGKHLCEGLLARGYPVRVLDRPHLDLEDARLLASRVEWLEGDFTNAVDVAAAIEGCRWVFHLVSTTLPKNSNENPLYDLESNVASTLRLLELAREGERKIIFLSSGGTVYGLPRTTPIPETHPTEPLCAYGIGKLAIEKYLELYRMLHGLDYAVVRLSNPYGEHQRTQGAQGVIPIFMHKALHHEPIEIWGDGSVIRDYVYIGDVVEALTRVMTHQGPERVINVGSGIGTSLNELVQILRDVTGRAIDCRYVAGRRFDVPASVLDISRARSALGWSPLVPLEEGIRRVYRHRLGRSPA